MPVRKIGDTGQILGFLFLGTEVVDKKRFVINRGSAPRGRLILDLRIPSMKHKPN